MNMITADIAAVSQSIEEWRANRQMLQTGNISSTVGGLIPQKRRTLHRLLGPLIDLCRDNPDWIRSLSLAHSLSLTKLELTYPHLPPALDNYRILHVTDPHLDGSPQAFERIADAVQNVDVDAVIMTGDYVFRHFDRMAGTAAVRQMGELVRIVKPADDVAVVTLGNHDYADMREQFHAVGIPCLINESVVVRKGNARLVITGTDDVYRFYTPAASAALQQTAKDPQEFRLAAIHSAELAGVAAHNKYDLYLCGHTHGGQVCLKAGHPLAVLLHAHKNLSSGLWQIGDMQGYTSRGIGTSDVPLRFRCPAEVTLLTLRRGVMGSSLVA